LRIHDPMEVLVDLAQTAGIDVAQLLNHLNIVG
jgi:hypothetical protein